MKRDERDDKFAFALRRANPQEASDDGERKRRRDYGSDENSRHGFNLGHALHRQVATKLSQT